MGPDPWLRGRALKSWDSGDTPGLWEVVICPNRYFLSVLAEAFGCK